MPADILVAGAAGLVAGALTSAATFACGADLPLAIVIFAPGPWLLLIETVASLLFWRCSGQLVRGLAVLKLEKRRCA